MDINYQEILNFLVQFMYISAPIAIIFAVFGKITEFFISFVRGDKEVKL